MRGSDSDGVLGGPGNFNLGRESVGNRMCGSLIRGSEIDGRCTLGMRSRGSLTRGSEIRGSETLGMRRRGSVRRRSGRLSAAWPKAASSAAAGASHIHSPRGPRRAINLSDIT